MTLLPFKTSAMASIGMELEFQIIDPVTYDLASQAKDLLQNMGENVYPAQVKPEITQSMIEINTSIHHASKELYKELLALQAILLKKAKKIGICFAGGGSHPFQKWASQKIFPTKRFKDKAREYRYLIKNSIFGLHIHIGCESGEDAIYLTHALSRYVAQLIAISASSPFYQGNDTGFDSSRSNFFGAFPTGGIIPYLPSWEAFSNYFYEMCRLGVIETMKDFYWDIRPKPEFGTVEIRVCDTPLTLEKATLIAAYAQSLCYYLLQEKPIILKPDLYFLYPYNHFQAARYGLSGEFINPCTLEKSTIAEDVLETIETIKSYSKLLKHTDLILQLKEQVDEKQNDAVLLRQLLKETGSFSKVVEEQCLIWVEGGKNLISV